MGATGGAIRELAERQWAGTSDEIFSPHASFRGLEEYQPGLAFIAAFGNAIALSTDEGLVLIDTSGPLNGFAVRGAIRASFCPSRSLHTAIYTHGHVDHVMGLYAFLSEERPAGAPPLRVVSHANVPLRFDRYKRSAGYNGHINARQFRLPVPFWPTEYRYPDEVYTSAHTLRIGGEELRLYHARGETDDHTFVHLPERRVVCTGDLFIWASPNCGNPQKAQRYAFEWAQALRRMQELRCELLLPGHGPPIEGAERVAQALSETAELLETLHDQTLSLMNEGAPLDVILRKVRAPEELLRRPYLRPVYDEPTFIVRNIWRGYGGWWDGNPAHLKPAGEDRLAAEVAALSGGAAVLIERARALSDAGEHALACHLAEWAGRAAASDPLVRELRAAIYRRRAESETSLMARSLYQHAAEHAPEPPTGT